MRFEVFWRIAHNHFVFADDISSAIEKTQAEQGLLTSEKFSAEYSGPEVLTDSKTGEEIGEYSRWRLSWSSEGVEEIKAASTSDAVKKFLEKAKGRPDAGGNFDKLEAIASVN